MRDRYDYRDFEANWRIKWQEADLFRTREEGHRPKFYGLDFFPYPSGAGLSVGHCRNYIPTDVLCRMKFMQGYNVLHPMGFDAFGLPAENEAIKRKTHPAPMIDQYAATYRRQMDLIGISYDWSREVNSSHPNYYRWTQWIFKLLYDRGLAYRKMAAVNWDPVDKTVLADEEVVGGRAERSGALVEKKYIPQWFFKITDYAQRLIDDLDDLDWPEGIKNQQRNWIGRSEGVEFSMRVEFDSPNPKSEPDEFGIEILSESAEPSFRAFTTRIDTIFGMTFCVLAPEHPLVETIKARVTAEQRAAIGAYQLAAKELSDIDRQATTREKSGVFTGAFAINPVTGQRVPLFVADYVLMGYGTGAIMAVPGHDQRDMDFARQYGAAVVPVIRPSESFLREHFGLGDFDAEAAFARYSADPVAYSGGVSFDSKDSTLINSGEFNGLSVTDGQIKLGEWIEALGIGERKVNYKLRDWLISRQRYWGCPIPMAYDRDGEMETVPDDALPVLLPEVDNYEPAGDGSSPLAHIPEFVNTTTRNGSLGTRESDTMGGFACSSWYFLRFCDPHNDSAGWDPERVKYWMPVDCYVGGAEHAVMHLLYARFWTKVLYDAGLVTVKEPFARLMNQGQVLAQTPYRASREDEKLGVGEDGILMSFADAKGMNADELHWKWVRMSKSKGNVVTPDEAVEQFGADALRVYELFVAPFEQAVQWNNDGMAGASRFLSRVFRLVHDHHAHWDPNWATTLATEPADGKTREIRRATHQLIKKASEDIERFAFNTYIAACMTFVNSINEISKGLTSPSVNERAALSEAMESLALILAPAAPHTADEIWSSLGREGFTYHAAWPTFDAELAKADLLTLAIQVNGKLRDTLEVPAESTQDELEAVARASEKVQTWIEGKTIRKVIVVPGRLVNIVVG